MALLVVAAACAPASGATPGQSANTSVNPAQASIQSDQLPKDGNGVPVVARVNNTEITLPELQRMMQRYGQQPSSPRILLTTMIQQVLIDQAAAQSNVQVTDDEVSQELARLIGDAGGSEAWQRWLNANSYTEDELRGTLRDTLITSRMRDRLTEDLSGAVAQVHARHILVKSQDEASGLLVRLRNGEDFAALAAQYSLDTSTSSDGGDLGWFTREELLTPELGQVAFQLQPGQIAGPVQTALGYHILQTLERADRPIDPEKRAQLAQNRFESWLNTLAAAAKIEQYL
jgi:parvulin-like peptidyl-prolyl isomerase